MDMRVAGRVREAAEAVGNGVEPWTTLLKAWHELGAADSATFFAWDKRSGELWGHAAADLQTPTAVASYIDHYQSLDPLIPVGLANPAGTLIDSESDLPTSVWRSREYYADCLQPLRMEQTIALTVCNDPEHLASFSLHFSVESNKACLKEQAGALVPTLIDAFRARLRYREWECCKLNTVVTSDLEAWLLLDTSLRVRHACPAVGQLLSGAAALHVVDGRLCARHAALASRLAIAVAKARADGVPQTVHCAAGWGRVLRLALAPAPAHLLMFNEPLLLLRVQLLDAARLPDVDALRAVYGLTASEARLVRELVAGHSLDDCAFLFAVSRNTLRNQLSSVFRKMDCARQSEVVRLAALLS